MRLGEKFKNVKKLLEGKEVVENNIIEKYKIFSPSFVICRRNTFLIFFDPFETKVPKSSFGTLVFTS